MIAGYKPIEEVAVSTEQTVLNRLDLFLPELIEMLEDKTRRAKNPLKRDHLDRLTEELYALQHDVRDLRRKVKQDEQITSH